MAMPPRQVYLTDWQWEWLKKQPGGASSTLREIVDREMASMEITLHQIQETERKLAALKAAAPSSPQNSHRIAEAWAALVKEGLRRKDRRSQEGWLTGPAGKDWLKRQRVTHVELMTVWDAAATPKAAK